jgi:hypothetical protein
MVVSSEWNCKGFSARDLWRTSIISSQAVYMFSSVAENHFDLRPSISVAPRFFRSPIINFVFGLLNRMIGGSFVCCWEFHFTVTLAFRLLWQSISFYYFRQANFPYTRALPQLSHENQVNRVKICLEINRLCFYR